MSVIQDCGVAGLNGFQVFVKKAEKWGARRASVLAEWLRGHAVTGAAVATWIGQVGSLRVTYSGWLSLVPDMIAILLWESAEARVA